VPANIDQPMVDCFKRAGQQRIVDIISYLRKTNPNYNPPASIVDQKATDDAQREAATLQHLRDEAEARERAKQKAADIEKSDQVRKDAEAQAARLAVQKFSDKMKDRGYRVYSPIDLALDWQDLAKNKTKIALHGIYGSDSGHLVDSLGLDNPTKEQPIIRLDADNANRDSRKLLLECREHNQTCRIAVGGTIVQCARNAGALDEEPLPCLKVDEVFPIPEGMILEDQ
jgi:hypothetical protein